jgi:anaerobic selenocysteine-containing dehydrogenase
MYANAKPASLQWGLAFDQKANGMQLSHCAIILEAITGNLDVPGGQILGDASAGQNESGFGFEELGHDLIEKMIGLHEYPAYANTILNAHADLMLKAMETGEPYPIKFGFYAGNNLMSCTSAEPKRWHDAMVKSLEFCFTVDCFMTPSAQATCDIFLPLATAAEEDGVAFAHYGATPVGTGFMNKALSIGECKTDMETCFTVGKLLNPQMWAEYDTVYDFIDHLRLYRKHHFKDVAKEVYVQTGVEYYKYESGHLRPDGKPGFNTPTGRVELYSTIFQQYGDDPLPYYEEPQHSPISSPEEFKEYPFVLTTGART